MTIPWKRLCLAVALPAVAGLGVFLILRAFEQNLLYYYRPTQVLAGEAPQYRDFRLAGLVVTGSLQRDGDTLDTEFVLTDTEANIGVRYSGPLPDLFREGQGVVAIGKLAADGSFTAREVLARHDENYMPPEVADALKQAGAEPVAP